MTAGRSPRGLATQHLQPAGRSPLLHPRATQSPPLASRGCTWEALGTLLSLDVPQKECRTRAAARREQQQQRQQELTPRTKQLPEGQRGQNQLTSSCAALLYAAKPGTAAQAALAHIPPSPLPERLHLRRGLPGRSRRGRRKAELELQPWWGKAHRKKALCAHRGLAAWGNIPASCSGGSACWHNHSGIFFCRLVVS